MAADTPAAGQFGDQRTIASSPEGIPRSCEARKLPLDKKLDHTDPIWPRPGAREIPAGAQHAIHVFPDSVGKNARLGLLRLRERSDALARKRILTKN